MIHIFLKATERSQNLIPKFERFLEAYNLAIIKRTETRSTIEIVINSAGVEEVKWVNNLALDFFNGDVISLRIDVRPVAEAKINSGRLDKPANSQSGQHVGD